MWAWARPGALPNSTSNPLPNTASTYAITHSPKGAVSPFWVLASPAELLKHASQHHAHSKPALRTQATAQPSPPPSSVPLLSSSGPSSLSAVRVGAKAKVSSSPITPSSGGNSSSSSQHRRRVGPRQPLTENIAPLPNHPTRRSSSHEEEEEQPPSPHYRAHHATSGGSNDGNALLLSGGKWAFSSVFPPPSPRYPFSFPFSPVPSRLLVIKMRRQCLLPPCLTGPLSLPPSSTLHEIQKRP